MINIKTKSSFRCSNFWQFLCSILGLKGENTIDLHVLQHIVLHDDITWFYLIHTLCWTIQPCLDFILILQKWYPSLFQFSLVYTLC